MYLIALYTQVNMSSERAAVKWFQAGAWAVHRMTWIMTVMVSMAKAQMGNRMKSFFAMGQLVTEQ